METEGKIFQAPDTNGVIKSSWQHLLLVAIAIVVANNSIYLLCKSIDSVPFLVNTIYLIGAAGCQALLAGPAFYRYEQAKIALTTDRRKASLFGVVFRENFRFQKTYDALGRTTGLLKGIVLLSLGLALIAYNDLTGLQFTTGILGLLIVFCLLADWLWMPILLSITFMVIAAHQSFGAQDIKTFSVVALAGLECLCFAWFIGNKIESIRFNAARAGDRQNRTQITLLALTFLVIASAIFMVLPKKPDLKMNSDKQSQVNRQSNKTSSQRRPKSLPHNKSGQRSPSTLAQQKGQSSGQKSTSSQSSRQQSDAGLPNLPEQGDAGENQDQTAGQNDSGATKSGKSNQSDSNVQQKDENLGADNPDATQSSQAPENNAQEENGGNEDFQKFSDDLKNPGSNLKNNPANSIKNLSKINSGNGTAKESGKGNGKKNGKGTENGFEKGKSGSPTKEQNKDSGVIQTKSSPGQPKSATQKTSKILPDKPQKPAKAKQPEKPLPKINKKTIVIVLLVLMLIALIVVLIKGMKKKKKKGPNEKPELELPTAAELSAAMRKFRQEYQGLMATPTSSDADRRARMIALYNLLLQHYESCGLAKPEYFTPDDFDRFEFIYRAPGKKALAYITSSFNRAYYGLKIPAQQEYLNYCNCIAELGVMLAKMAPRAS